MRVSDRRRRFWLALLTAGLCATAAISDAQQAAPDAAQLQHALTRAQGLLQQLSQQKNQLEADNVEQQAARARVERELARERGERRDLEDDLATSRREGQNTASQLETTRSRLERVEERLQEVVDKYKVLAAEHRETLSDKAGVENELQEATAALEEARTRNEDLYQANRELLQKYMDKGPWTALLQREPLTGLRQVEMENIEQDFRFRNEDGRLRDAGADDTNNPAEGAPQAETLVD